MTSASETLSPLEILGVPKWIVVNALAKGDLTRILRAANGAYGYLARIFHPDRADDPDTDDDDGARWAQISTAIEEIRTPGALPTLAQWYVDPSAVAQARKATVLKRMADHEARIRERLAGILVNIDPMRVLETEVPVRFIAAIFDPEMPQGSYYQAVIGEMADSDLRISLSEPLMDENGIITLHGKPSLAEPGGPWSDNAFSGSGKWNLPKSVVRVQLSRVKALAGEPQLIGGVAHDDLVEGEWVRSKAKESVGTALEMPVRMPAITTTARRGLVWDPLYVAWWVPLLQAHVQVGDYLVLMNTGDDPPTFALAGPLLAMQPI